MTDFVEENYWVIHERAYNKYQVTVAVTKLRASSHSKIVQRCNKNSGVQVSEDRSELSA
jgi:hypothetical protein